MSLKDTKTEENLKDAFAGESQANRRYLYFAAKADVEGYNDVAAVFRSTAEGETGHAHGHLEYLEQTGDPATGLPIGETSQNLKAAIASCLCELPQPASGPCPPARDPSAEKARAACPGIRIRRENHRADGPPWEPSPRKPAYLAPSPQSTWRRWNRCWANCREAWGKGGQKRRIPVYPCST